MPTVYRYRFMVTEEVIDGNGHVNNVAYVQWMQDSAVRHSNAQGATPDFYAGLGVTWVVHSHFVEYLRPALAGDRLEVVTWVTDLRRSGSLRKYKFARLSDGREVARARTEWVLVNVASGRPCTIRDEIRQLFEVVPPEDEP